MQCRQRRQFDHRRDTYAEERTEVHLHRPPRRLYGQLGGCRLRCAVHAGKVPGEEVGDAAPGQEAVPKSILRHPPRTIRTIRTVARRAVTKRRKVPRRSPVDRRTHQHDLVGAPHDPEELGKEAPRLVRRHRGDHHAVGVELGELGDEEGKVVPSNEHRPVAPTPGGRAERVVKGNLRPEDPQPMLQPCPLLLRHLEVGGRRRQVRVTLCAVPPLADTARRDVAAETGAGGPLVHRVFLAPVPREGLTLVVLVAVPLLLGQLVQKPPPPPPP